MNNAVSVGFFVVIGIAAVTFTIAWEYYGACSTYGCGERRFLVAKSTMSRHNRVST